MANAQGQKKSAAAKLLLIGNSFTQRNNLPGMLQDLAFARGLLLVHDLIGVGGASLRTSAIDGGFTAKQNHQPRMCHGDYRA